MVDSSTEMQSSRCFSFSLMILLMMLMRWVSNSSPPKDSTLDLNTWLNSSQVLKVPTLRQNSINSSLTSPQSVIQTPRLSNSWRMREPWMMMENVAKTASSDFGLNWVPPRIYQVTLTLFSIQQLNLLIPLMSIQGVSSVAQTFGRFTKDFWAEGTTETYLSVGTNSSNYWQISTDGTKYPGGLTNKL